MILSILGGGNCILILHFKGCVSCQQVKCKGCCVGDEYMMLKLKSTHSVLVESQQIFIHFATNSHLGLLTCNITPLWTQTDVVPENPFAIKGVCWIQHSGGGHFSPTWTGVLKASIRALDKSSSSGQMYTVRVIMYEIIKQQACFKTQASLAAVHSHAEPLCLW